MTTPGFHDVRLPEHIESGSKGGPEFNTTVIEMTSGREQRVKRWALPRMTWDISYGIRDQEDYQTILAFFYARRGRAFGFRFKDWSDFSVLGSLIGTGTAVDVPAKATLTFNTNPANSTTVTIDGTVYTLTTGNADAAFKVHIGADIATTRQNLKDAINATGVAGTTTYGVGTTIHPTVTASLGTTAKLIVTAKSGGTSGNSLAVSTTIDGAWNNATLTGGLNAATTGTGLDTFQLTKTYADNVLPFVRAITKPISGTLVVYDNGSPVSASNYDIDYSTGIMVFHTGFVPLATHLVTADFEFDIPARFDSDKIDVVLDWVDAGTIDPLVIRELREFS